MYQKWYQVSLFHHKKLFGNPTCTGHPQPPHAWQICPAKSENGPWAETMIPKKDECLDGPPKNRNRDEWGPNTSPKHMPQTMPSKKGTNAHSFFFLKHAKKKERMQKKMERMQTKKGRMHIRPFFFECSYVANWSLRAAFVPFFVQPKKKGRMRWKKGRTRLKKGTNAIEASFWGSPQKRNECQKKTGTNVIFTHSSLFLCAFVPFFSRSKKKGRMS